MKVVYVTTLPLTGPVSHVLDLAPRVTDKGVDVTVVCANREIANRFRQVELEASVIPLKHKLDLVGAARVRSALKGADLVHTHDRRAGLLARPQAPMIGAKAVHTLHGIPDEIFVEVGRHGEAPTPPGVSRAEILRSQGVLRMEAWLSRFGTVVVPSRALADFAVTHGFPPTRVVVIPNGVAVERTEAPPAHDPPVVATAAILEYRKGVDVLLEAWARVHAPGQLEIFGSGTLRGVLEAQAARLGIDVVFRGFVPDMRRRLEDVDVFVLPTRGDNLPVAILEAMALALPVVSTRVGGVPELVVDGVTGLLVEPDDASALAAALTRVLTDPDERRRFGRQGAKRVAEHFDADAVASRMVGLYEELLATR